MRSPIPDIKPEENLPSYEIRPATAPVIFNIRQKKDEKSWYKRI